ncbi:MAG: GtrA family protein [Bacilli bacterium]|nr:GtrA family protein [Bacilli bacterium]
MKNDKIINLLEKIINKFPIKFNKKQEKLILQIFKFTLVGGFAFIVDYLILILCKELINLNTLLSAFLAFTVSVIVNYLLSIKYVFDVNKEKNSKRNFIIFIIFSIVGLILTELIMYFGEYTLHINYLIVKIVATIVVMIFNFITRKLFLER